MCTCCRHVMNLFKIRHVLDHLFLKFQEVFQPGENIAIDESLLLRKGRLIFKQYIPLKRATFGIKSFLLSDNSGYTFHFQVYTGKDEYTTDIDDLPLNTQLSGRSGQEVFYQMLPLLNKGHRRFVDYWYTSVDLFELLHSHGISCCGTLRSNRTPPRFSLF
ncbi:piggyBac transposable element-derived protein 4 [Aplysia californica]|uniref:PiggyBac transposable element-derived protein 4 n=1 Tax=Aplysia californica TaxID=6500 RepID=A0ABM0JCH4_APLCA|nr:piggyBac transposable element-derived protein 4 [Aplysia californica]